MNDWQPSIAFRAKEGARRIVREILVAAALTIAVLYAFLSQPEGSHLSIIGTIIYGIPIGIVLWLAYRVVRFAVGY
jgi:hypothetical protein